MQELTPVTWDDGPLRSRGIAARSTAGWIESQAAACKNAEEGHDQARDLARRSQASTEGTHSLRGPPGDRTLNPRIKSPLLCRLS